MSKSLTGSVAQSLGDLFEQGSLLGCSEAELLRRFRSGRDERAFRALVERFGPMVRGVCRALVPDAHLADDAFQATFLVLVRRAGCIADPDRLGPWLYGVATRVARKARSSDVRRRLRERPPHDGLPEPVEPSASDPSDTLAVTEAIPLIHQELERLPARYRDPIVLCLLDGQTQEAAAQRLKCPVGTVKGRLWRARRLLRDRLERRGIALSAGLLVTSLRDVARAHVPESLIAQTAAAALSWGHAAKGAAASTTALLLAERVASTMFGPTLKLAATSIVALGLVTASAAVLGHAFQRDAGVADVVAEPIAGQDFQTRDIAQAAPAKEADPLADANASPADSAFSKEADPSVPSRIHAAREFFDAAKTFYQNGTITIDRYLSASERLMQAESAEATSPQMRVDSLAQHVARIREALQSERARFDVGTGSLPNRTEAQLTLAEAEAALQQARVIAVNDPTVALNFDPLLDFAARNFEPPADRPEGMDDPKSLVILEALERPVSLPFTDDVPLADVVKYVTTATTGEELPAGIQIYLDPLGLQEASATDQSPVRINLEGISLKKGLYLALRPLGLSYTIQDGLLIISTREQLDRILFDSPVYQGKRPIEEPAQQGFQ